MITYLVTYACRHTDWATTRPANGTRVTCTTCRKTTTVTKSQRWTP